MDVKRFYGTKPRNLLALIPENPQESDSENLSNDDDEIDDPEYLPTLKEVCPFESDDDAEASTSTSSAPPPRKKRRGKNTLKVISMEELGDPWPKKRHRDLEEGRH